MNLDLKELLSDGPYKEKYRKDMITWSDEVRAREYGYFCESAMEKGKQFFINKVYLLNRLNNSMKNSLAITSLTQRDESNNINSYFINRITEKTNINIPTYI